MFTTASSPTEHRYLEEFCCFFFFFCSLVSRLGFLGLLHMEVFNQRLEQEYNASVILTTPTVPYKAVLSSAKLIKVLLHHFYFVSAWKGKFNKDVYMYILNTREMFSLFVSKSLLRMIYFWVKVNKNFYYLLKTNSCFTFLSSISLLTKLLVVIVKRIRNKKAIII